MVDSNKLLASNNVTPNGATLTILEKLATNALLMNSTTNGYKTHSASEFTDCVEYHIMSAIESNFKLSEDNTNFLLVEYSNGMPQNIFFPAIWLDPHSGFLVYRVGKTSFTIEWSIGEGQDGLSCFGHKLFYDTKVINEKNLLYFSILLPDKTLLQADIIYKEITDTREFNAIIEQVKTNFRVGDYPNGLFLLQSLIRDYPEPKATSSISDIFRHIMVTPGLFDKVVKDKVFAAILTSPHAYTDRFGAAINFDFDGEGFALHIGLDYDVKTWGGVKKLSEVTAICFKSNHIDKSGVLTRILGGEKVPFVLLIINGPNKKDPKNFPQFTLVDGNQILKSIPLQQTVKNMLPALDFDALAAIEIKSLPSGIDEIFAESVNNLSLD